MNNKVQEIMKEIEKNPNIKLWKDFTWPEQIPLTTRLKDILEKTVDEKYYLSGDKVENILANFIARQNEASGINLKDQATTFDGLTDVAHTLMARDYKGFGNQSMTGVIEPFIVASRGRNPDNPSDRTTGSPTEQRLEANMNGTTNTITTVAKDNYVMEPQVLRAERTDYGKKIRKQYEAGEVYEKISNMREMMPRTDGISNTITTIQKDNYVMEPIIYDDYNSRIPQDQNAITTLTTNCGASAVRNGVKIIEPVVCEQRTDEGLRFFKDNVVGTLRTTDACGDKRVINPDDMNPVRIGNIYGEQFGTGYAGNVWDQDSVSPTIMTAQGGNRQPLVVDSVRWRIRKLMPVECYKLMAFTKTDCQKASCYVSDSTLYKTAGNSIVVNVLIAIFSSLLLENGYKSEVWTKYIVNPDE